MSAWRILYGLIAVSFELTAANGLTCSSKINIA